MSHASPVYQEERAYDDEEEVCDAYADDGERVEYVEQHKHVPDVEESSEPEEYIMTPAPKKRTAQKRKHAHHEESEPESEYSRSGPPPRQRRSAGGRARTSRAEEDDDASAASAAAHPTESEPESEYSRAGPPSRQHRTHRVPTDEEHQAHLNAIAPTHRGMQLALGAPDNALLLGSAADIQEYVPLEAKKSRASRPFCFMCMYDPIGATRRDAEKEAMCDLVRKFKEFSRLAREKYTIDNAAQFISVYYIQNIQEFVPDEHPWPVDSIILHYTQHSTDAGDTSAHIQRVF